MPRLPLLPKTLDERLLLVIVVLGLALAGAGAKILRLQEQIAAKPAVEDRIIYKRVQGPIRVEVRTITKPGGEVVVERIRTVERVEIERENAHLEAPATPLARPRTRYLGLGVDPLRYAALPRLRAGVTFFAGRLDAGVAYDARFSPVAGAFGLELAYRF